MIRHASTYFLKVGVLLTGLISSAAGAANFTVTNLNDSGPGSLREAIAQANNTPGDDIITFSVSGTITLSSTLPEITDTTGGLTINGTGNSITVNGHGARVIIVSSGATLNLEHLKVVGGSTGGTGSGGGLWNRGGTVTVSNSTFSGNSAYSGGGGILNEGTLTVTNSTFSGLQPIALENN